MDQFDALLVAKEITKPCHSPSRAVVLARERAKRRQGRMWVGLLSDEMFIVRSAEAVESKATLLGLRFRRAPGV